MLPTLKNRTTPEFYGEYVKRLRENGVSQAGVELIVAESIREATCLLAGKCPQCGAPSARYVSARQHAPTNVPGTWVQYRCSTQPPPGELRPEGCCDFMLDLTEVEEEIITP